LNLKEEKWNFGKTEQGKILTHVFKFKNAGDAPLKVRKVHTSCGCAAALVSKKEIAPGANGEIKVTFNTRGYGGNISKFVYIESNDPENPRKQLLISAAIDIPPQPKIQLDRYSVDLGLFLESEPMETEVKIMNTGELELQVELAHKAAKFFVASDPAPSPLIIPAGKDISVGIKVTPRKKAGLIREYVLLKTNDPMRPNLSLYISGYIITKPQLKDLFQRYQKILK